MAKKNEKETKKNPRESKKEKKILMDGSDRSKRALVRAARRVKMSEINSLSNHERKKLEKRTDKRYARMLKRMNTLFPIMLLIYGIAAILAFTYYKAEIMFLILLPLLVVFTFSGAYRKGLSISVILSPVIRVAEFVVIAVLAHIYKYSLTIGLSAAISAIPDIISEIRTGTFENYISYIFTWMILATVVGLILRLIDHPRKYFLKHEYVKMQNGD